MTFATKMSGLTARQVGITGSATKSGSAKLAVRMRCVNQCFLKHCGYDTKVITAKSYRLYMSELPIKCNEEWQCAVGMMCAHSKYQRTCNHASAHRCVIVKAQTSECKIYR